jgi:thymidylate kinase
LSYHRRRGRVVLLDRFTYDAALPSDDLDWRGKLTAAVTGRLSRAPDAVLLLDAPAEVMYARKGEQGLSVLARDRNAYRRLVAGHGRATVIDATLPAVQVRAHAHEALWQLLAPAGL